MLVGYYEAASTPGLWRHKWRPIQFCLNVDDFGIEYVGIEHFNHLLDLLKKYHGVQFDMYGTKFAGIDIKWDYTNGRCRISMDGYIDTLLINFDHPRRTIPRLSPYKCVPIAYGSKTQLLPEIDTSELLDDTRKLRIQEIVGSLLYYARAVDNKQLVALSAIAARQATATIATKKARISSLITSPLIQMTALSTEQETCSCAHMQMQDFSMNLRLTAGRVPTST